MKTAFAAPRSLASLARSLGGPGLLGAFVFALGCAGSLRAQAPPEAGSLTEVELRSGATIRADLLDADPERLVLDLGYTVIRVPASQIVATRTPSDETDSDPNGPAKVGGKGVVRGDFNEMVESLEEAVVIVSNPGGYGAGFIIDAEGLVITNHHVVLGEKYNDVTIFLRGAGGKREKKVFREVEVKAFSSLLDCALLRIPDDALEDVDLPVLALADPDSLRDSMGVYAIGNPGVGSKMLDHTVSQGIISSRSRNFNDILYLQTTAAVNPGNSGGPLLNRRGEVVGLVTFRAIFQEGLAFALPVSYLAHFIENSKAFEPTRDSKSTGYRYHSPRKRDAAGDPKE